jgi:hypothetical protein
VSGIRTRSLITAGSSKVPEEIEGKIEPMPDGSNFGGEFIGTRAILSGRVRY